MKSFFNYSLRGLLFVFPLAATGYVVFKAVDWANRTFNGLLFEWMNVNIPGLGIISVFLLLAMTGWMVSKCMTWPAFKYIDDLFKRMPLIKIIYTSLKELTEAFMGDERKFNIPVIYRLNNSGVLRFGFITHENLHDMGLPEHVAVYSPHSYNFSGNLFIVPQNQVQRINANSTDMMKYIISAGVTDFNFKSSSSGQIMEKFD